MVAVAPSAAAQSQAAPKPLLQHVWQLLQDPLQSFREDGARGRNLVFHLQGIGQRKGEQLVAARTMCKPALVRFYVGLKCPPSPLWLHGYAVPCQEVRAEQRMGESEGDPHPPASPSSGSRHGIGLGWAEQGALQGWVVGAAGCVLWMPAGSIQLEQRLSCLESSHGICSVLWFCTMLNQAESAQGSTSHQEAPPAPSL